MDALERPLSIDVWLGHTGRQMQVGSCSAVSRTVVRHLWHNPEPYCSFVNSRGCVLEGCGRYGVQQGVHQASPPGRQFTFDGHHLRSYL
jgi:hypothetical protein